MYLAYVTPGTKRGGDMGVRTLRSSLLLGGMVLCSRVAQATLHDRDGGLIYDNVHKITSLRDVYFYVLVCVIYMAFVVLLGWCVGFNELEEDR
jgi:hypothetical protein